MDDECGYAWIDRAHPGHDRQPGQHMCIQHTGHTNGHACCCGAITWDQTIDDTEVIEFTITVNRSELVPGGEGARIGYSDAFPGRQFLMLPTR